MRNCKICNGEYSAFGRTATCSKEECRAAYLTLSEKRSRENDKTYRAKIREKAIAYKKLWYQRNRESSKEKTLQWQINNREKYKEMMRAGAQRWRKRNPEKSLEAHRKYRQNHKAERSLYRSIRRARIAGISTPDADLIFAWESQWRNKISNRCFWCKKITKTGQCHADHIVALNNGGEHSVENLCISCCKCNLSKGHKELFVWNASIKEPVLL